MINEKEAGSASGILKSISPVKTSKRGSKYFGFTLVNGLTPYLECLLSLVHMNSSRLFVLKRVL